MPMLVHLPVVVGLPVSCPVVVLNVAHEGLLMTAKLGLSPAVSVAVGVNEYVVLTATVVAGVPEMVSGAVEGVPEGGGVLDAVTVMLNQSTFDIAVPL